MIQVNLVLVHAGGGEQLYLKASLKAEVDDEWELNKGLLQLL